LVGWKKKTKKKNQTARLVNSGGKSPNTTVLCNTTLGEERGGKKNGQYLIPVDRMAPETGC